MPLTIVRSLTIVLDLELGSQPSPSNTQKTDATDGISLRGGSEVLSFQAASTLRAAYYSLDDIPERSISPLDLHDSKWEPTAYRDSRRGPLRRSWTDPVGIT